MAFFSEFYKTLEGQSYRPRIKCPQDLRAPLAPDQELPRRWMKEEMEEQEGLPHQHKEVRAGQPLRRVGPEQGPSLGLQTLVQERGPAQVVLARGHVAVVDHVGHQDRGRDLEGQVLETVEGHDPPDEDLDHQEDLDQDPAPEIWRETVFTWQILTATQPNVIWRKHLQSLDLWLRFGWRGVFLASLLLSTRTRRMPMKPVGQLMVKMCAEEEFV